MRAARWLPVAAVVLVAAGFSWLNRDIRIPVSLGVAEFYRAPLTMVVFLAFLAGMLSMLALSLRHDRRVREVLRAHGLLDAAPERAATPLASPAGRPFAEDAPDTDSTAVHFAPDDDVRDRTVAYPHAPAPGAAPDGAPVVDDRTAAAPPPPLPPDSVRTSHEADGVDAGDADEAQRLRPADADDHTVIPPVADPDAADRDRSP